MKTKQKNNWILIIGLLLLTILSILSLIEKPTITGEFKQSKISSCRIPTTGKTYDNCMWFYLDKEENSIKEIPWGGIMITGAVKYIKEHLHNAKIGGNATIWEKIIETMNKNLNTKFQTKLTNLDKKAKENSKKTILIAWNYRIINSQQKWWKKIITNYDFYYENKNGLQQYDTSTATFYYRPDKGTVKR